MTSVASSRFEGRSAIVSGAGSGIGRATALMLARDGAASLAIDISEQAAQQVVQDIASAGGVAKTFVADVTDLGCVRGSVKAASRMTPLKIAINNVGTGGERRILTDVSEGDWRRVLSVNVDAVFLALGEQIPSIVHAGGGAIVNVASVFGLVGNPMSTAHVTSKHALIGLTKNAAIEFATAGVRVNSVAPGFIETPLFRETYSSDAIEAITVKHPMGRLGRPEEVADLITFLASESASFITGSCHSIDGGYTAI